MRSESTASDVINHYKSQTPEAQALAKPQVQRILQLHNITKKQTILVFVAFLSSAVIWTKAVFDSGDMKELGWDVVVNSICAWMMLHSSEPFWNFCKKHGCCQCCYVEENSVGM